MSYLVLRYDDFGFGNAAYDEEVLRLSTQLGLPITVGVVPGLVSRVLLDKLASTPNVEVAMHGIVHRRAGAFGEFAGTKDWYTELLAHFRSTLEHQVGRPVRIFIPPWHIVDRTYLGMLPVAGFSVVSGGPSPSQFKMFACLPDRFVPFSTSPPALEKLPLGEDASRIAVALWHHYNITIDELRRILVAVSRNSQVRFVSLGAAADLLGSGVAHTAYCRSNAVIQRGRSWIHNSMIQNGCERNQDLYRTWRAQQFLHLEVPPGNEMPPTWRLVAAFRDWLDTMRSNIASHRHLG